MGIKVLVVDDEKYERLLISNLIHWEEDGLVSVGEAASAKEAVEVYEKEKPEIVLTDISMPETDGLELCRRLKKMNSRVKLVIITGFREFEYAKQAIKIGVDDFLLKPIEEDEVNKLLIHIREEIIEQDAKEKMLNDSLPLLTEDYIRRLLRGDEKPEETMEKIMEYHRVPFKLDTVQVCIVKFMKASLHREDISRSIGIFREMTEDFLFCRLYESELVLICPGLERTVYEKFEENMSMVSEVGTVMLAVSRIHKGVTSVGEAFRESRTVIMGSLQNISSLIFYEDYREMEKKAEQLYPRDFGEYIQAVKAGNLSAAVAFIDSYLEEYIRSEVTSAIQLRNMGVILLFNLEEGLNQWGKGLSDILEEDIYRQAAEVKNLKQFCTLFYELLEKTSEYVKNLKSSTVNTAVQSCREYILENLATPGLSLKNIAEQMYLNESYLSRIFKQATGESVNRFLMRCRIEKSMELLSTTTMKAYEVGERVGMPDAHYFGLAFKKYTGKTINEFKSQNREG